MTIDPTQQWAYIAPTSKIYIDEVFEVIKPGYFKRFVWCVTDDDARLLGRVIYGLGCTMRRVARGSPQVHYELPDDAARAMLELTLYFTGTDPYDPNLVGRLPPEKRP